MKGFEQTDTWIFDLDNTLYPASCRLFDQIHKRMTAFVMKRFGMEHDEARKMQKDMYHKYGTTLRGLMVEYNEKPEAFLTQAHDIDYSSVNEDADLQDALLGLPGRKIVFTAGTTAHARRVLARLGVADAFEAIFDIADADHVPKPEREPYEKFVSRFAIAGPRSAFFEDIARNLKVPHDMGMTTVLVRSDENHDASHLNDGSEMGHIHYQTPQLGMFLSQLAARWEQQ